MAGFTNAEAQRVLDNEFPATGSGDYVAYSVNGTSEWAGLARTAIGDWEPATSADPSVKANADALTSAAATADGTITHYAIFSAATGGRQRTDWQAVTTSKPITTGDPATWEAGGVRFSLT